MCTRSCRWKEMIDLVSSRRAWMGKRYTAEKPDVSFVVHDTPIPSSRHPDGSVADLSHGLFVLSGQSPHTPPLLFTAFPARPELLPSRVEVSSSAYRHSSCHPPPSPCNVVCRAWCLPRVYGVLHAKASIPYASSRSSPWASINCGLLLLENLK